MNHRQFKHRCEIDETGKFPARICSPAPAIHHRVLRIDRNCHSIEASKPPDNRRTPVFTNLKETALINERRHDASHVVALSRISWHHIDEPLIASSRVIAPIFKRRKFVYGGRQIRQKLQRFFKCLRLGVDRIIDGPIASVNVSVTKFVLRDRSQTSLFDECWSGDHHLRGISNHDRIVRRGCASGSETCHRAQHEGD